MTSVHSQCFLFFRKPLNGSSTFKKAENLVPRDIMSFEPRHWIVFGQLVSSSGGASAQHCTGMTNWPHTIQSLGSDDIMASNLLLLKVMVLNHHDFQILRIPDAGDEGRTLRFQPDPSANAPKD